MECGKTKPCPYCGEQILAVAIKCKHCGEFLNQEKHKLEIASVEQNEANKIAELQKISNILWLIISVLMILNGLSFFGLQEDVSNFTGGQDYFGMISNCTINGWSYIIIGGWNIIALQSYRAYPDLIRERSKEIPSLFENMTQLIVIAFINLVIGWYIGLALIAFDFYIRKRVIDNMDIFNRGNNEE